MSFWSGEKLTERISDIVEDGSLPMIDCSAVKLRIGAEVYVSPVKLKRGATIRTLSSNEAFVIPPGQFAFLITEERVHIPEDAMGLISIRARTKWRGLVNVSGFHVDPGYKGRLIFSVLNGGPSSVHLRRGDYCFLMWLADLDRPSKSFTRLGPGYDRIPSELVNNISSEFKTISGVSETVDRLRNELRVTQGSVVVLIGLVFAVVIHSFWPGVNGGPPAAASPAPSTTASRINPPSLPSPAIVLPAASTSPKR